MLAHIVRHRCLNQMDLLPIGGVQPRSGKSEVRAGVILHQPDLLRVENDATGNIGNIDRDVVDAGRCHWVGHESEPTT